jgi:hypothetical protein
MELNNSEGPQSPTSTTVYSEKLDEKSGLPHTNTTSTIQNGIVTKNKSWGLSFSSSANSRSMFSQMCRFGRTRSPPTDEEKGHPNNNPGMPDDFFQSCTGIALSQS